MYSLRILYGCFGSPIHVSLSYSICMCCLSVVNKQGLRTFSCFLTRRYSEPYVLGIITVCPRFMTNIRILVRNLRYTNVLLMVEKQMKTKLLIIF